ncbi:tRNA (adenine(22)-N(1))-methyltransferase [Vibrio aphrogenes]|uniref:tRNA (adenine(22)-N(1))-methyltransferase n=1 Tax=Vibrio aphrogenes TaxID=1891186 RepID=UPI000B34E0E2|nr:tRNA (adenine(22)-N(1))-methyltransferase TrmK [Vibrio aphrogenes]
MKLSRRLQYLDRLIPNHYQHIWDCCCDHGFLGASLLQRNAAPHIHFVDIVPTLMETVQQRLTHFFADAESQWSTYCLDVTQIPLNQYQGKQLVIIAGVGGDLMTEMVIALQSKFTHLEMDFLLCPVYQQFLLRRTLIEMNMSLQHEHLIEDKGRYYEVLWVSQPSSTPQAQPIHPVGSQLWHANDAAQAKIARQYLNNTLKHYQRMLLSSPIEAQQALTHYSEVQLVPNH